MSDLATSVPVTDSNEEIVVRVPCIYYPVRSQNEQIRALLNNGSKINTINPDYTWKLGLKIRKTNVGAQKIDSSALETFEIVIADFQVENKANRPKFFQEIFLVANTKFEVMLGMLFLKINNTDVLFSEETLTWRTYTTNDVLLITEQVQIVDLKEFVIATLDIDSETFMVYMAIWEQERILIHSKKQA